MNRMNNRGFTLIELLVTILVASVLLAALLVLYRQGLLFWRGQVEALEARDHLRIGLDRVAREIHAAERIVKIEPSGDDITLLCTNGVRVRYYHQPEGRQLLHRVHGVSNSAALGVDKFEVFASPDGLITLRLTGGLREGEPLVLETSVWMRSAGD